MTEITSLPPGWSGLRKTTPPEECRQAEAQGLQPVTAYYFDAYEDDAGDPGDWTFHRLAYVDSAGKVVASGNPAEDEDAELPEGYYIAVQVLVDE